MTNAMKTLDQRTSGTGRQGADVHADDSLRARANKLSDSQRHALRLRGMQIIYGASINKVHANSR